MAYDVTISGITGGTPPYTLYVCDEYGNNCQLLGSTGGTFVLSSLFQTADTLMFKIVDSTLCEYFEIVSCPPEYLLQENGFYILQEDGFRIYL
jgi:hypothetical protein